MLRGYCLKILFQGAITTQIHHKIIKRLSEIISASPEARCLAATRGKFLTSNHPRLTEPSALIPTLTLFTSQDLKAHSVYKCVCGQ